ncbi:MAG: hypothetical protein LBF27_17505 [Sphingobacterium sp.]|jgi:hypothetical protein|nr:hypothetical protein [Sphingobacterium sp.]
MIKSKINSTYPHQFLKYRTCSSDLHLADYTEQTKTAPVKKGIEFFSPNPPSDITFFSLKNENQLSIGYIDFDNSSFVNSDGSPKSQCECTIIPNISDESSFVILVELKYSTLIRNNSANLSKAIQQLTDTHSYYFNEGIIKFSNPSYLFASIPPQSIPFRGFTLTPAYLLNLKISKNIILSLRNDAKIENHKSVSFP